MAFRKFVSRTFVACWFLTVVLFSDISNYVCVCVYIDIYSLSFAHFIVRLRKRVTQNQEARTKECCIRSLKVLVGFYLFIILLDPMV